MSSTTRRKTVNTESNFKCLTTSSNLNFKNKQSWCLICRTPSDGRLQMQTLFPIFRGVTLATLGPWLHHIILDDSPAIGSKTVGEPTNIFAQFCISGQGARLRFSICQSQSNYKYRDDNAVYKVLYSQNCHVSRSRTLPDSFLYSPVNCEAFL